MRVQMQRTGPRVQSSEKQTSWCWAAEGSGQSAHLAGAPALGTLHGPAAVLTDWRSAKAAWHSPRGPLPQGGQLWCTAYTPGSGHKDQARTGDTDLKPHLNQSLPRPRWPPHCPCLIPCTRIPISGSALLPQAPSTPQLLLQPAELLCHLRRSLPQLTR